MDPINNLDGIAELLRKRISAEVAAKGGVRSTEKSGETQAQHATQRISPEALRKKIALGIDAINSEDPKRNKKIVHIFVENVLIWQFGEELINDPRFSSFVDEVGATLESEPSILQQLIDETRDVT